MGELVQKPSSHMENTPLTDHISLKHSRWQKGSLTASVLLTVSALVCVSMLSPGSAQATHRNCKLARAGVGRHRPELNRVMLLALFQGGKFDIIQLVVYIGSTLSYFGLVRGSLPHP